MNFDKPNLTTEEAAALLGIKGQSMRVQFCRSGSYFGVVPTKLPNSRLLWPTAEVEGLVKGMRA